MLYGSSFNVLTFSLINIQFAFPGKNRFCGHKRIWDREAIRKQINSRGGKWKCIPCLCLHKLGKEKEKWNRIITDVKKNQTWAIRLNHRNISLWSRSWHLTWPVSGWSSETQPLVSPFSLPRPRSALQELKEQSDWHVCNASGQLLPGTLCKVHRKVKCLLTPEQVPSTSSNFLI